MLNSVSGIYLFSSPSFSVLLLQSIEISHVQPNVRIHFASVFIFLFFFIPVEGLCCRPKYGVNIIHRFDDQNSLTSKCIENWTLFERLTHSQQSALSVCPRGPWGCAQHKALESQLFFVQFKDAYISTFQRPDLH